MKAIVYDDPRKIVVKDVPKPRVGPRDLLIKVKAAGICGSDLEMKRGNRPDVTPPRIPGHEVAGEARALNNKISSWRQSCRGADHIVRNMPKLQSWQVQCMQRAGVRRCAY